MWSLCLKYNYVINNDINYDINNDIIFTENWFYPLKLNNGNISIPVNNQLFQYQSDCGNLRLKVTMRLEEFKDNYHLLNDIVQTHNTGCC